VANRCKSCFNGRKDVQQKKLVPSDPKLSLNPTPACTAQSFATG
jgi:hypothetical protein